MTVPNYVITQARIKNFECPSDAQAGENLLRDPSNGFTANDFYHFINAKRSSYFFSTGVMTDYDNVFDLTNNDIRQGAFGNNGSARIAQITDGTSNSIAMGEACGGRRKSSPVYGPWALQGGHTCCHGRVPSQSSTVLDATTIVSANFWSTNWCINCDWIGGATPAPPVPGKSYAWVFNSWHPGGAQFVMTDGSVQFLSNTIDYLNFARLAYIHDAQVVSAIQ
jgi:prepilin-type processing-associated H-X9-DG protein